MKDRVVRFTGLTLNASDIIGTFQNRKAKGPFPATWERVEVPISAYEYGKDFIGAMDDYIASNFEGRWGVYQNEHESKLIVFFEDSNDAVMFKLMDSHTAYLENAQE